MTNPNKRTYEGKTRQSIPRPTRVAAMNNEIKYYIHNDERWRRKLHREDGPAHILPKSSTEYWYQYGVYHRRRGPAVIGKDIKQWYRRGALHRTDGPASIMTSGFSWLIHGEYLSFDRWCKRLGKTHAERAALLLEFF